MDFASAEPAGRDEREARASQIGNRVSASVDAALSGTRSTSYTSNALNQYTSIGTPNAFDVIGSAASSAIVKVNTETADRLGPYFRKEVTVNNSASAVWQGLNLEFTLSAAGVGGGDIVTQRSGHHYVAPATSSPTYDEDGNLTSDSRWTYTWDGENRLVSMESNSTALSAGVPKRRLEFLYDGQSRRISKKVMDWNAANSAWTTKDECRFVYEGWNLVAELNPSGNLIKSHTWGMDLSGTAQGAGGVGGLLWSNDVANTQVLFAAYDGNGNVVAMISTTDSPAKVKARYDYNAFGETVLQEGDGTVASNTFRFSTKYQDEETGLYDYGFRYYQPETGRWLSRDPAEEGGGLNLYGFIGNNGINGVDFLGLWKSTGNNQYEAEAGDTLRSLAQQVSQSEDDWSCLWPVSSGSGRGRSGMKDRYPNVCPGDVYDASNLVTPCPNAKSLSLILERDFASVDRRIFPGAQVINGNRVAQRIRSVSGEGKTPISNLVITGHCGAGSNSISGTTSAFIFFSRHGSFNLQDLLALDKAPTFDRAKAKKGPLRCWFARDTAARFVACSSETFAQNFASRVLRRGSTATGTNQTIAVDIVGGNPTAYWNYQAINGQNVPTQSGDFWNAPFWRTYNGGL